MPCSLLHKCVGFTIDVYLFTQDYITRRLQQENDQVQEDERLIRQYREETEKMRNQIEELKTRSGTFHDYH